MGIYLAVKKNKNKKISYLSETALSIRIKRYSGARAVAGNACLQTHAVHVYGQFCVAWIGRIEKRFVPTRLERSEELGPC